MTNLKGAEYSGNITLRQKTKGKQHGISLLALSVSGNSQLIAGHLEDRSVHIYTTSGAYLATYRVPDGDILRDATWTPKGKTLAVNCFMLLFHHCAVLEIRMFTIMYLAVVVDDADNLSCIIIAICALLRQLTMFDNQS